MTNLPPPPVTLAELPAGWSRQSVPPAAVRRANEVLKMPLEYGDGIVETIDGVTYAFRREPHYDDHVDGVLRWHPGISVWTKTGASDADPFRRFTPVSSAPMTAQAGTYGVSMSAAFALGMVAGYLFWAKPGS